MLEKLNVAPGTIIYSSPARRIGQLNRRRVVALDVGRGDSRPRLPVHAV
jgi:hypothetical protein